MTPTYDHWCVVQAGVAFFSHAKTREEALAQAREHLDPADEPIYEWKSGRVEHGEMCLVPCTAKASKSDCDRGWHESADGICHESEVSE